MENNKMQWWREARFGMFIHWGLYAVPAGVYEGKVIPSLSEWIMKYARIPFSEYSRYAEQFTGDRFDADEWVRLARDTGMKYICITSKHHDGFAMYDSACCDYNIVKKTPFGRDPMKELAAACEKYGLTLCFYYSQAQDWAHPDGIGNDWDFGPEENKQFDTYLNEKVLPQLTELLTNYGRIGLIWFDTPMSITEEQSRIIVNHVHSLQPDCIISGRIGHGLADYRSSGDNTIPLLPTSEDWECPATVNDTWGFKNCDQNWKDPYNLIRLMVDIAGKNGNYLLNVGPDSHGVIPEKSVEILREVGRWMKVNGDSIYGTIPAPVTSYEMPGMMLTHRPGRLFLHVFGNPDNETWPWKALVMPNVDIDMKRVYFLNDPETDIEAWCMYSASDRTHMTIIPLDGGFSCDPGAVCSSHAEGVNPSRPLAEMFPEHTDTVLCIEYEGEIRIEKF